MSSLFALARAGSLFDGLFRWRFDAFLRRLPWRQIVSADRPAPAPAEPSLLARSSGEADEYCDADKSD